jgi:hypothetical protein
MQPLFIVSPHRPGVSVEVSRERRDRAVSALAKAFPHVRAIPAVGSFEGETEPTIILQSVEGMPPRAIALALGIAWGQQSILGVDPFGSASLVEMDSPHEPIALGEWQEVPKVVALSQAGWTYDPATGLYFVASTEALAPTHITREVG